MLVLALRNVLRAAEMARRYAGRPEKQNLRGLQLLSSKPRLPAQEARPRRSDSSLAVSDLS